MPFTTLGLSDPLLRAIADAGYTSPSPIQSEAIPAVLGGHDVLAAAQTERVNSRIYPCLSCIAYRKRLTAITGR